MRKRVLMVLAAALMLFASGTVAHAGNLQVNFATSWQFGTQSPVFFGAVVASDTVPLISATILVNDQPVAEPYVEQQFSVAGTAPYASGWKWTKSGATIAGGDTLTFMITDADNNVQAKTLTCVQLSPNWVTCR